MENLILRCIILHSVQWCNNIIYIDLYNLLILHRDQTETPMCRIALVPILLARRWAFGYTLLFICTSNKLTHFYHLLIKYNLLKLIPCLSKQFNLFTNSNGCRNIIYRRRGSCPTLDSVSRTVTPFWPCAYKICIGTFIFINAVGTASSEKCTSPCLENHLLPLKASWFVADLI